MIVKAVVTANPNPLMDHFYQRAGRSNHHENTQQTKVSFIFMESDEKLICRLDLRSDKRRHEIPSKNACTTCINYNKASSEKSPPSL